MTTTELADELVGGVMSAGPHRLEAACRKGIPQLVCPGAIDMVNFGPAETVPAKFRSRKLYVHNPTVTLMRTTPEECAEIGRITAIRLNRATGPVTVLIPLQGVSAIDKLGGPFYSHEALNSYRSALKASLIPPSTGRGGRAHQRREIRACRRRTSDGIAWRFNGGGGGAFTEVRQCADLVACTRSVQ